MLLIKALHYHLLLELDIKLRPYPTKWTWPEHKQVHYWQKVQYFEDQLVHLAFPYHQWRLGTWVRSDIWQFFRLFVCCMSCSELHGYCRSTTYWLMIDWGRKLCELCEPSAPSCNNNVEQRHKILSGIDSGQFWGGRGVLITFLWTEPTKTISPPFWRICCRKDLCISLLGKLSNVTLVTIVHGMSEKSGWVGEPDLVDRFPNLLFVYVGEPDKV